MNYYFDCEFIEGFHKPLFGKRRHHIDLISIGIVCEDGRRYYAISKEYNFNDASDWVKENVIIQIYREQLTVFKQQFMDIKTFHKYIPDGKTNEQIVGELYQFISCPKGHTVDFYGYYSDYDWVLFCSLFGTMMDLPKGFPMYCKDLKQMLDDKAESLTNEGFVGIPSFENKINFLKAAVNYPKQNNEHNALADAEWNMQLHKFLKTF